jgi:hypothetical protein
MVNNADGYRSLLTEIKNAGLKPIVWPVPDDAPVMAKKQSMRLNRFSSLKSHVQHQRCMR